jgi:hypothetical protein
VELIAIYGVDGQIPSVLDAVERLLLMLFMSDLSFAR